jgi:SAM-dependent methyltransferase
LRNSVVAREIRPPFLDIACGDNRLARSIAGGVGVDILDHGYADLIVQDLAHLPFPAAVFQSVSIVASLNYFDDAEQVLCECARLLRPDGVVIVTLLNPMIGKMWHFIREPWAKYPGFSSAQLAELSRASRLRIARKSRFMLGINDLYLLKK